MEQLKALQNGSDIRGIAVDYKEQLANLTPKQVQAIALGTINWLCQERQLDRASLTIAVGHDSRVTADSLKEALITTFLAQGISVIDVGLATTPAMFMATQYPAYDCDAAIMITASHLPFYFNGLKFFTKAGGAEKADIHYILSHSDVVEVNQTSGTIKTANLLRDYGADLVAKIRKGIGATQEKPLAGMRIIVDAGNGAGGFFASEVLESLGADTTGSQFLEPDGHFPNHVPNPDNPVAMASIQKAVLTYQADLGIIFDTDVDRAALVAADGQVLNRNNLIAVLASIVLAEYPGTRIVTNSTTSNHLKDFITALGGQQVRYISGYRNVINKMTELNLQGKQTELAIETSGHAAFRENYSLDDGAYVVAKILMLLPKLAEQQQTLGELIARLQQPAESQELRFKILDSKIQVYGEQVIRDLESFVSLKKNWQIDPENEEGIRVTVTGDDGSGWFLLRMSLHEPLLVLQIENDFSGKNQQVLNELSQFFKNYHQLSGITI